MPAFLSKLLTILLFADLALILIFTPLTFGTVSNWAQLNYFALILTAVVLWLLLKLLQSQPVFLLTPLHLPLLLIALLLAAHVLFSPAPYFARREFWLFLSYLMLFLILTDCLRTRKRIFGFLILIFLLAGVLSAYGLAANWLIPGEVFGLGPSQIDVPQAINISPLGISFYPRPKPVGYLGRVDAPFLCPDHLAGYLELVLPFMLALLVIVPLSLVLKIWLVYFFLIVSAAFLFTLSRGGWLSALAGLIVFWRGEVTKRFPSLFWRNALLVGLVALLVIIGAGIRPIRERVSESLNGREAAIQVRLRIWEGTWRMIKKKPLFGWGLGTFRWVYPRYRCRSHYREANFAHNDYLHIWAELGLVGLFSFLWLALSALKLTFGRSLRKLPRRYRAMVVGLRISLIIFLVHSFFDFNLHIPANAVLLVALTSLGMASLQRGGRRFREIQVKFGAGGKVLFRTLGVVILVLLSYPAANKIFRARKAEVLFLRAKYEQSRLEWKEADRLLGRAIEEDPANPFLYALRGEIQSALFRWSWRNREEYFQKAIHAYREALSRNPRWADLRVERGRLFQGERDYAAAEEDFKAALRLDPNNAFYHDLLGMLYLETGREVEARSQFHEALKIAPHDSLAIRQLKLWE